MKKELSEKQMEAKTLYSQIVQIDMTEVPFTWVSEYGCRHANYVMCNVNGIKYVHASQLSDTVFSSMEKKGLIDRSDFLYCRRGGNCPERGPLYKMIKVSTALNFKNELLKSCFDVSRMRGSLKLFEDDAFELPEITIDESVLRQSEMLYFKRFELLQEVREEKRKEKGREALEKLKNEQQHREQSQESETLKDLVSKIEAMGWDVTLSLKPV